MITFKATQQALVDAGISPQSLYEEAFKVSQEETVIKQLGLATSFQLADFASDDNGNERQTFAFVTHEKTVYISVTKRADCFPTGFEQAVFQQMVAEKQVVYRPLNNAKEA